MCAFVRDDPEGGRFLILRRLVENEWHQHRCIEDEVRLDLAVANTRLPCNCNTSLCRWCAPAEMASKTIWISANPGMATSPSIPA